MTLNQLVSDQFIISCLHTYYGIDVAGLAILPLGADIDASVYKAVATDLRVYFVKVKRARFDDMGVRVVERLFDEGIKQVIAPVKTLQGLLAQQTEEFIVIVYPFIEGQDGFSRDLTDSQWGMLGRALRQVHELEVPQDMQKGIRREGYDPKWRYVLRSLFIHIQAHKYPDEVGLKLLTFMQAHMPTISRLLDRAEFLGQRLQGQTQQYVLCHSDIHAGNVLIGQNDDIFIVDWDEVILAPKERDLMFIGAGVANVWNKPREVELFYKGYGKTTVNSTIIAYYRHERIVQDIVEYANALLLSSAGGSDRLKMYNHFIAMFEPRGVVEIAFESE